MNFHKTIGFLATLLLTLGLGVPDSFAQAPAALNSVTLTLNAQATLSVTEGGPAQAVTVSVNVTYGGDVDGAKTQVVTLGPAMGSAILGTFTPELPSSVNVTVADDSQTGTAVTSVHVYTPPAIDDDTVPQTVSLEAKAGDQIGTATISIANSGGTLVTSVTLDLDGDATGTGVSVAEGGGVTPVTVSVTVVLTVAAEKGYTRDVVVDLADNQTLVGKFAPKLPITVPVTANDDDLTMATGTMILRYTPADEDDAEDENETFNLQASVGTQTSDATVTVDDINIIDTIEITLNDGAILTVDEDAGQVGVALVVSVGLANVSQDGDERSVVVDLGKGEELVGTFSPSFPITVTATTSGQTATGSAALVYTPAQDDDTDDATFELTASTAGEDEDTKVTPTASVNVTDNDTVSEIGLTIAPAMVKEDAGATTITLTATVVFVNGEDAGARDVVVDLATGGVGSFSMTTDDGEGGTTVTAVTVTVPQGSPGTVTVIYTPVDDTNTVPEKIELEASITNEAVTGKATLTVEDLSVSAGVITITTSLDEIRENVRARDVVVTAALSEASTDDVTVAVKAEVMGQDPKETETVTAEIVIAAGDTEGSVTVSLDPANDDVFTDRTIRVTGNADAAGYTSDTADIAVLDDDDSIGSLAITVVSPPSVTIGSSAQNVTLTIKGVLSDKLEDEGTVDATVVTNAGAFTKYVYTDAAGDEVTVTVSPSAKSVDVPITMKDHPDLVPDEDSPDGISVVTLSLTAANVASAGAITVSIASDMYDGGSRVIPITSRSALDIAGYRAVIVKPAADGGWANVGNHKIEVDVMRVGTVAYPWSQFEKIKVSVRDTAHDTEDAELELEVVTAEGFNLEDNGSVTFEEPGSPSRGDVVWKGNDTIRFRIKVRDYSDSRDPVESGQYLGTYAHIEFTSGSAKTSFSTRDDEQPVYPSNPTLVDEANRYRGDGKLIKVDNLKPGNTAIAAVRITSGSGEDEEVGRAIDATVGDEIRVAVKVSGNVLFRESGLRIQLRTHDGTGEYQGIKYIAAKVAPVTVTKLFTAAQVIASTSDSLLHSWKINEGFFKMKTDDYIEGIGAKGVTFQPDNAGAQVLVAIGDQAGNWSGNKVTAFNADSRSPSVTILYPSAAPDSIYEHADPLRFTGRALDFFEGQNVDAHLNPLAILVDEVLSKLEVYAVGADTLDIFDQIPGNIIGDSTAVYGTQDLNSPKKVPEKDLVEDSTSEELVFVPSSENIAGTEIELAVLATDVLGNVTKTTISGVTHDAARPELTDWFPKTSLLPDDQINDATPPIFTLAEDVDSIAVRFTAAGGADVIKERGGVTTKGEDSFDFSGELEQDAVYEMTIFVRDLAGNVYITPADSSSNMRFNSEFDNPIATRYTITAGMDSVIAGQANMLTIQAEDHDAESNTSRNGLTYKNAARISAWDTDGGAAESVWFEGTGVDDDADSPDGVAMLSAADWRIGKRTVTVKSNKATGFVKILVQHLDSGEGDTAVVGFDSAIDSIYVGAADFAGFELTAWEEGVEGAAAEIWGDYTLRVVPIDRHGNPSVRAFKLDDDGNLDSLDVLDTRVDNAFEYKNGIDVEIVGVPSIEDFALLILAIEPGGTTYDLVAPDNRRSQTVQVRVVNESLEEDDDRSQNVRSSEKFTISAPLTPVLTLRVPGSDVDEAGNDVVIPADPGDITVTVAAAGFNAGDMVTFTRNGTAMDPGPADDDGVARLDITASLAGTTTVSASNGVYSTDELSIVFTETPAEPAVKSYATADGLPVYLVYSGDAPPDMTVGLDDFNAFAMAFGSSEGDDNYNLRADVDGDGDVDLDDYSAFIASYGRTAAGPATKPIVLLPGINENAEFSLSLGSERVVAGELVAVDVSLANVAALVGYGFALNYETDKFEFVSVAPADEDLLKSTGGETPLFYHIVADGQVEVVNSVVNGTAVSGGGDIVRFVFRVLREFEDSARFEIADGLVFDPSQLSNPAVIAGVLELQSTPREFALHQNFPNPFNPDTTIKYDLAESADVTLQIYNVLGQVVRTLVASEAQNAGRYQIRWSGMDDRGVPVSSGIYFYQISADGKFHNVRKLMLLK